MHDKRGATVSDRLDGAQVSFHALARAPALARAARAELYDRQHSGVIETGGGEAIEFAAHAAEVERQHAAWLAVDTDAKQEARVNKARARFRVWVRVEAGVRVGGWGWGWDCGEGKGQGLPRAHVMPAHVIGRTHTPR